MLLNPSPRTASSSCPLTSTFRSRVSPCARSIALASWEMVWMNLLLRSTMIAKPAKRSTIVETTILFTVTRISRSTLFIQNRHIQQIRVLPVEDLHKIIIKKSAFFHEPEFFVDQVIDDRYRKRLAEDTALFFHLRIQNALFPFDGQIAENAHHHDNRARRDEDELKLEALPRKIIGQPGHRRIFG